MSTGGIDGGASLFSGGGFMPSQSTQTTTEVSASKNRGGQTLLPLTVKQISEAFDSNDDKSSFVVDGVEATNLRLVGIVTNKTERVTNVYFTLDDGTGRVEINRWVQETSDANEMTIIQNGMYVVVNGSLKGFQGKKQVVAFSVRPVIDFNAVVLHFIECIHVHLVNNKSKILGAGLASADTVSGVHTPAVNVFSSHTGTNGASDSLYQKVLNVFQEPAGISPEHGLHVNEVAQRLGIPMDKIRNAIEYHVEVGHIYSTIDENHFKSTLNG